MIIMMKMKVDDKEHGNCSDCDTVTELVQNEVEDETNQVIVPSRHSVMHNELTDCMV